MRVPLNTFKIMRRIHREEGGAVATEYLLILALVVIPLACMTPVFYWMIKTYSGRLTDGVSLPVP